MLLSKFFKSESHLTIIYSEAGSVTRGQNHKGPLFEIFPRNAQQAIFRGLMQSCKDTTDQHHSVKSARTCKALQMIRNLK